MPSLTPSFEPSDTHSNDPTLNPTSSMAPSSTSFPTVTYTPTRSSKPSLSLSPSSNPSLSVSPSVWPSPGPTSNPTAFIRRHYADDSIFMRDLSGNMTAATTTVFETVALRMLLDLFPMVDGLSINFLYVQVTKQAFIERNQRRKLEGDVHVDFKVAADILPGDPEHFDFQWVIETFFSVNYDEFLARLEASSDFFYSSNGHGVVNQKAKSPESEESSGNNFFTMPILVGLAAAALAMFVLGTLVTRIARRRDGHQHRAENEMYEGRLGSLPLYTNENEEEHSLFSTVEDDILANQAKIFRIPYYAEDSYSYSTGQTGSKYHQSIITPSQHDCEVSCVVTTTSDGSKSVSTTL